MMFMDRQANNAIPALATMFLSTTAAYTAFVQPINFDYLDRFTVLWDKSFSTSSDYGGSSVGNDPRQLYRYSCPLDETVYYTANAGTYADISSNTLWAFVVSNSSTGSVNTQDMNVWVRVLYYDV